MPAAEVLDSHALLTLLRDEPGAETVARILERAGQRDQPVHMTEVNDAEVQYMIRRKDGDDAWTVVAAGLNALPIHSHPADRRLADAFAAALTREKQGRLITGDPEFKPLEKEISITWLQ